MASWTHRSYLAVLAVGALALSCGGKGGFIGGEVDGGQDAGQDAGIACTPGTATLDGLYASWFAQSQPTGCATSACHGGTASAGLTFRSAAELYAATVGVRSTELPTQHRVEPGHPETSVLYQKLLASAASRMPVGGPYLDDATLAALAGWICAGAPPPSAGGPDGGAPDGGAPDAGAPDAGALTVDSFTPTSGLEGTQVTITGTGFAPSAAGDTVHFNGTLAQVRSANATTIEAVVPAGATSGPLSVTVAGQTAQSALSFQVLTLNPIPTLSSVSPSTVQVGTAATLTLAGTGFVAGAVVQLDGAGLPTTFVSATQVTATLGASAFSTPGSHQLTVTTPSPGGGTTGSVALTAANPAPALSSLTPSAVPVGSATQNVTFTGTGFVAGSVARLDGAALPTTFVSSTQLTVSVSAATFATAGTHLATVTNASPGGGTSAAVSFSVNNPAPTLSAISPATVPTGSPAFTLSVTGTGFVAASVVKLDGTAVTTTFVSATALSAAMPSFASSGTHTITVTTPTPGGGTSSGVTLTVQTLTTPFISALSPSPATANQAFTLTVTGVNFLCTGAGAKVSFGTSTLTPSSCSTTQLVVSAPSTAAGSVNVQVVNPNTQTSNLVALTVVAPNPVPVLSTLTPSSATAGGAAFTLTAAGTGFATGASLTFNGAACTTTVVSATQVTASIPSTAIASAGTYPVVVTNPAPGGGASNSLGFTVTAPNPVPSVSSLSPSSVAAGSSAFTLTITGTGFIASSSATFNGVARTTTYGSATSLSVAIQASDVATAGSYPVVVTNPAPGGGASNSVSFTVSAVNPVPVLSSLTPSTIATGSGATTVSVTGSGFISGTQVSFNGSARTTTYVSATTVNVALTATDTGTAGTYPVVATNPSPGGGTSNTLNVTVSTQNPVPAITAMSPCGTVAGSPGFTMTITGTGFIAGSVVKLGTTTLSSTTGSSTSISATVPSTLIATAPSGYWLPLTVANPSPGGGTSNTETFGVASATQTLSGNVQPFFTSTCATSACHSGSTPQAGLDLSAGVSRGNLVGVASTQCAGEVRVTLCAPTRPLSVLVDKILATSSSPACSGTPMPKAAPLTAAQKQMIVDWVAQGSP